MSNSLSNSQRMIYSFMGGVLFLGLASPKMYNLIDNIIQFCKNKDPDAMAAGWCPTAGGHLTMTVLFLIAFMLIGLVYNLLLGPTERPHFERMLGIGILNMLIFYLVSNRELFMVTNQLNVDLTSCDCLPALKLDIADELGCPRPAGVVLHAILFTIFSAFAMSL